MEEERTHRRLAAIVSADVAGFSRLMEADEAGTLALLKSHRAVTDAKITEYGGRIVGTAGDSLLIEFPSTTGAVSCALDMQALMAERNRDVAPAKRMEYRIGVNLGDVMIEGDDIFGNGVNVAARLQELAEPGGVCISGSVHEQVRTSLNLGYEDLGPQEVKNIAQPVRAYRVLADYGRASAPATDPRPEPLPLPDKPSIAVLPFDNMSGDPEQEYFADGIAEDIITALSRISWFFVTARNSSFTYKGAAVDAKQIGRELGVRYILEGSVRKSGARVRITAQLVDAATGNHVWADRFDRDLSDIFEVQDEITRNVVASTHTQVQLREGSYFENFERPSLPVWALVNRAGSLWYELTHEALTEATRLAQQAVALDPESGRAHQILAVTQWNMYWMGFADDLALVLQQARRSATRALRLNGHDEYAHWVHGLILMAEGAHDKAVAELEHAIEINPNCSLAYGSLGTVLNFAGRPGDAIVNNEIAIRSNPRDPTIFMRYSGLALSHFLLGEYEAAVEWAKKSVQQKPEWYQAHAILCASYAELERMADARAAVREYLTQFPSASVSDTLRIPLQIPEHRQRLANALGKAGLPD